MKKIIGILFLLLSSPVFAQETVASLAENVIKEIDGLPDALGAASYVFGIVLGVKAILKFKEHNESKGQVKIGIPIVMIIASALFLGLPTVLRVGVDAIGYKSSTNFEYRY